jgi:hypothetical protein
MSLNTPAEVTASALAVIGLANQLKAAKAQAAVYSAYNGVTDPGWGSLTNPIFLDTFGNVIGTGATPTEISNAIGSINEFLNYYNGQAVATSPWGNNLEAISSPTV